ncbi:MAG: hypothetical protein ACE364_00560 [Chlorobiota bacterium]
MNYLRPIDNPNRLTIDELESYVNLMYQYDINKPLFQDLISLKDGLGLEEYQQNLVMLYELKRQDDRIKANEYKLKSKELEFKKQVENSTMLDKQNYNNAVMSYNSFEPEQILNGGEGLIFTSLQIALKLEDEDFDRVIRTVSMNKDFNLASIMYNYNHEATKLAVETSYIKDNKLYPEGTEMLIDKYVMYESIKNGKDINELRRNIDNRILDNSTGL